MPRSTTAFVPPNLSIGAATTLPPVSLDRAPIISTPIAASQSRSVSNRVSPNRLAPIAASSTSLPGDSTAGAELPDGLEPRTQSRAWQYIVLHHTATDAGDIETIDEAHRKRTDSSGRPWLGIGYHFLIGNGHPMPDGLVEPTFRWHDQLHGATPPAVNTMNEESAFALSATSRSNRPHNDRSKRHADSCTRWSSAMASMRRTFCATATSPKPSARGRYFRSRRSLVIRPHRAHYLRPRHHCPRCHSSQRHCRAPHATVRFPYELPSSYIDPPFPRLIQA